MSNPLIVALDVPSIDEASTLAKHIGDAAGAFKIGMELFYAAGPDAVRSIDAPIFLDLKLHDIPTTVARSMRALAPLRPAMVNVHALGGRAMLEAAVADKPEGTALLAVTILTSLHDAALAEIGLPPAQDAVSLLATLAVDAGCDGVVCAPADLETVRAVAPDDFLIVTPGIRPADHSQDEHARGTTPAEAMKAGATHIVVGRPITRATDPGAAARAILEEL
ncbi:MAG: orotidine-5'-phosphate decarboxylase [Actinomycetota bacterium]|nr:orotidine-5'-phosphate decarboxylase [Actinomycetota bacterium]